MRIMNWLLEVSLSMIGLLLSVALKVDFLQSVKSMFKPESNLFLKLRLLKMRRVLPRKVLAMSAWAKKVEDKTFALTGGNVNFVSEALPAI